MAKKTPEQLWPGGLSRPQLRATVAMLVVLAAMVAISALDATVIAAAPVAVGLAVFAVARPNIAFIVFVCLLALIPIEHAFLGFYVPNWTQALVPMLLVGVVLYNLGHPERKAFAFNWADVFLLAFIVFGLIGIKTQPGPSSFKFFINQQVFPALAYFIVKWLPLNRARFHTLLRWQLGAVIALSVIMVGRVATGFDPFYHGFGWLGFGGEAIGPMGSISDTVAYTAIFPAFFLYAIAVTLTRTRPAEGLSVKRKRRVTRGWWFGLIMVMLATMATTERTGIIAIAAAFAVAVLNRRLFRPVAIMALVLPLLIPLWVISPVGQKAAERLGTLKEEGAGFERHIYRDKALDYTRSQYWNPLVGTGFGRISSVCVKTMPQDAWFFDYNWSQFRKLSEFADRPTHCAPVTLYAEYGYAGIVTLGGFALFVLGGLVRARKWARDHGRRPDDALILAGLGAFLGIMANGMFHNTEAVVEVLFLTWAYGGLVIGHPEIFAMDSSTEAQVP